MVRVYEAQGRPVLQLSTWENHQQIRAKKSKYPAPDEICNQLISNDSNSPRNRESKYENRESVNGDAHAIEPVRHFEEFLSAYPKDCNSYLTETAYIDLLLTGKITEGELVKCAVNYAESCKILQTQDMYIKNAENFLKDMVFERYLPGKYKKPTPQKPKNSFNDFKQNQYDYDDLLQKVKIN